MIIIVKKDDRIKYAYKINSFEKRGERKQGCFDEISFISVVDGVSRQDSITANEHHEVSIVSDCNQKIADYFAKQIEGGNCFCWEEV